MAWGIPYCPEVSLLTAPEPAESPLLPSNLRGKILKAHSRFLNRRESRSDKESPLLNTPLPADQKPKVRLPASSTAKFHSQSNNGKPRQSLSGSNVRGEAGRPKLRGQHGGFLLRDLLLFGKNAQFLCEACPPHFSKGHCP